MANGFGERLAAVREKIESACRKANRSPAEVTLVAVSKTHPASRVSEAVDAGVRVFGENKVQEGIEKIPVIGRDRCAWHLIGHLQKNKVRKAVQNFDVIETVDSDDLAIRLDRIAGEEGIRDLPVLIQVDLGREETKSGVYVEDLDRLVDTVTGCNILSLKGLMTIPPYFQDVEMVRPYFRKLAEIRDQLAERGAFGGSRGELSMGMSHDFETAIEEGATIVRVGTAIFGPRGTAQ